MTITDIYYDDLRNLTIGTVESVSPTEVRILLDINAPQNTSLNTGEPTLFPKINGYVLIPSEAGSLVCIISWIGTEYSSYPKRKGFKDFDLIDLPFPLRKMTVNPLGIIKKEKAGNYKIDRGVYSYPSVGDSVVIPTRKQLRSIVENKDKNACIKIGVSPLAGNAAVFVDPDKLFGRHIAVLGNTGSGKSCSVTGLVRWSLKEAEKNLVEGKSKVNARFIILDPNGEYNNSFEDFSVRKFQVSLDKCVNGFKQLRVPAWMWNSYEWSSITQASGKTQRPLLRRALRELRGGNTDGSDSENLKLRRYLSLNSVLLNKTKNNGEFKSDATKFGFFLKSLFIDLASYKINDPEITERLNKASSTINNVAKKRYKSFTKDREFVEYYVAFELADVDEVINSIDSLLNIMGGILEYKGPDEDSPVYFNGEDLPNHLERLAQEQNVQQFLDFLIMRVRTVLSDTRMSNIVGTKDDINLLQWLEDYVGKDGGEEGLISLIDLSLVPSDILHIVVSVISRIVFEAIQRYRRINNSVLPTVLVMEEAHNFISRYNPDYEEMSPSRLCSQTFEKIAKEGRKFGLGLILSSQRPSELSPTVLSQCNSFLLHRLVNDRDQELVRKMVPDNLGKILAELPILPTRKAILLGWAAPVPVMVEMGELAEKYRPQSADPDFWDVWTGKKERIIDWEEIIAEWQKDHEEKQK